MSLLDRDMAGETNGPTLLAASWVLTILAFILLALRFYCKLSRGRPLWWDDYTLSVSWVRTLCQCIVPNVLLKLERIAHTSL